jgi:hypothetical protein
VIPPPSADLKLKQLGKLRESENGKFVGIEFEEAP